MHINEHTCGNWRFILMSSSVTLHLIFGDRISSLNLEINDLATQAGQNTLEIHLSRHP